HFVSGLEFDLATNLVGQPLVRQQVMKGLREFLENPNPMKPLVMSFHGSTGTGKTYVSSMLIRYLFQSGLQSPYVHHFSPIVHFPHAEQMEQYKVRDTAQQCHFTGGFWLSGLILSTYAFKLFPEVQTLHLPLLNFRRLFSARGSRVPQARGDRGGTGTLPRVFWLHTKQLFELQGPQRLSEGKTFSSFPCAGGFWKSGIINEHLIDFVVPFLPLKHHHVKQCVVSELVQQGLEVRPDVVQEVADSIPYFPEEEKLFSSTGCKTVASRISFFF
ncbi:TOR2A protein, partial [Hypocryptadius cinnamomeus]|nr:TOR2A protein [Hypocryptadius cinnamomeus]